MLVGFEVANFRSFKDAQRVSFRPGGAVRHKSHVAEMEGGRLLRAAIVVGANGGGKSNLVEALRFSSRIIASGTASADLRRALPWGGGPPGDRPGVFEYRLLLGGFEYGYGVALSYETGQFVGEWLFRVDNGGEETCLFDRETNDGGLCEVETGVRFGTEAERSGLERLLRPFRGDAPPAFRTRTILSALARQGGDGGIGIAAEARAALKWLEGVVFVAPDEGFLLLGELDLEELGELLGGFDLGIEEAILFDWPVAAGEDVPCPAGAFPVVFRRDGELLALRRDQAGRLAGGRVMFRHAGVEGPFSYGEESAGARRLAVLLALLARKDRPSAVVVDEIGASLHPLALRALAALFLEEAGDGAPQILATTCRTALLDLDLLREDEIWFVERTGDGRSAIYPLDRFRHLAGRPLYEQCLLGRYGGVPALGI